MDYRGGDCINAAGICASLEIVAVTSATSPKQSPGSSVFKNGWLSASIGALVQK
jgi:hypothetical protein